MRNGEEGDATLDALLSFHAGGTSINSPRPFSALTCSKQSHGDQEDDATLVGLSPLSAALVHALGNCRGCGEAVQHRCCTRGEDAVLRTPWLRGVFF
jgi:hypothetical protein